MHRGIRNMKLRAEIAGGKLTDAIGRWRRHHGVAVSASYIDRCTSLPTHGHLRRNHRPQSSLHAAKLPHDCRAGRRCGAVPLCPLRRDEWHRNFGPLGRMRSRPSARRCGQEGGDQMKQPDIFSKHMARRRFLGVGAGVAAASAVAGVCGTGAGLNTYDEGTREAGRAAAAAGAAAPTPAASSDHSMPASGVPGARSPVANSHRIRRRARAAGPEPNKTLLIESKDAVIEVAGGVMINAWTFEGVVPAKVIHVRQGDAVDFTLERLADGPLDRLPRRADAVERQLQDDPPARRSGSTGRRTSRASSCTTAARVLSCSTCQRHVWRHVVDPASPSRPRGSMCSCRASST